MTEWKERRRGTDPINSNQTNGTTVIPPSGVGEWDEGLGVPLCVVCQNAEKIENLEKELGWQEEDFDFVLQVMRAILLKRKREWHFEMDFGKLMLQQMALPLSTHQHSTQIQHNH